MHSMHYPKRYVVPMQHTERTMAQRKPTKSVRWDPDDEEEFVATLRRLQADGKVPNNLDRSEAIRRVLNGWAKDPVAEYLR